MTDYSPRLKTRLFQKISLIILGIFLAAILLEAVLRLGGFIILSMQEHRNALSIKNKVSCRILCVGESTTQNQYPPFLEKILNQHNTGVRFSVIDKGLAGANTSAILSNIEKYIATYKPDMVVAMMGINDFGAHMPLDRETSSKALLFLRTLRTYKLSRLLWLHITTRIKESAKLNSRDAGYYKRMGVLYHEQGKLSLAEETFKKGIALNPNDEGCYAGLGAVYHEQGNLPLAEEAFKKAIALDPDDSDSYGELGWAYRDGEKFSLAEDIFNKAIAVNPSDGSRYLRLGWLYHEQGKLSLAEEAFKKAAALDADDPDCYVGLGWAYHEQGKLSLAEDAFKKGIALDPKTDKIYGLLALVYEEEGQEGLAKEYYRKANELRISSVTIRNYRRLKEILDKRNVKLVCVQYPMLSLVPLKYIFAEDASGIIFVGNERTFKEGVRKEGCRAYFRDMFAGEFGHGTDKGNYLLAENISEAILKGAFGK